MSTFSAAFTGLKILLQPFLAAVGFLTIVPVPPLAADGEKSMAESLLCFPIVGLFIGMGAVALDWFLQLSLPTLPAAVGVILFLVAISGGLHMDGLADTADGFGSARPRNRILEIMRDSRIGTMGVIAVAAVILLKVSLLASAMPLRRWPVILLMPLAGRAAILVMMNLLPYARTEGGLASLFIEGRSRSQAVWGAAILIAAGGMTAGYLGLLSAALSLLVALLLCRYTHRKIGGFTGDTLGAVCEVAEIVPPLTAVAWIHLGLPL